MKRSYSALFIYTLIIVALIGCTNHLPTNKEVTEKDTKPNINQSSNLYVNTQYGFKFSLPESWKGYSIVSSTWEGLALDSQTGDTIVETGPLLSIRHPQWTSQNPRQDIPIMVFTLDQWNSLKQEKFHIGAAPIGPSELGRNKMPLLKASILLYKGALIYETKERFVRTGHKYNNCG